MSSILEFLKRHGRICTRCGERPKLRHRITGKVYNLCGVCAKKALDDIASDEEGDHMAEQFDYENQAG